ncbi:MAG: hypothetical protein M5R36_02705 [Deltaproteobacteria bacterium]|nr:hypothetical protein [Deltaproteobacteria bacterium]
MFARLGPTPECGVMEVPPVVDAVHDEGVVHDAAPPLFQKGGDQIHALGRVGAGLADIVDAHGYGRVFSSEKLTEPRGIVVARPGAPSVGERIAGADENEAVAVVAFAGNDLALAVSVDPKIEGGFDRHEEKGCSKGRNRTHGGAKTAASLANFLKAAMIPSRPPSLEINSIFHKSHTSRFMITQFAQAVHIYFAPRDFFIATCATRRDGW